MTILVMTILVSTFFFISFGDYAIAGQKPPTVSTVNFSAPDSSNLTASTTDIIGITMNSIRANNMDKLMNETIAPFINNSTSRITTNSESPANEEREINQPILTTNSSEIVADTNNQDQKSPMEDHSSSNVNSPISFTSNQTVLLQFQDPASYDIINKLEGIKNLINKQISVENATQTVATSAQESNNKMVQDLSQIKTSINRGLAASDSLRSIQMSKNEITQDLSQLKPSINKPSFWSSYLSRAVISSIVAAIVSAVVILLLLHTYRTRIGVRFNELKFKREYR
jgi:hypothetical protein